MPTAHHATQNEVASDRLSMTDTLAIVGGWLAIPQRLAPLPAPRLVHLSDLNRVVAR